MFGFIAGVVRQVFRSEDILILGKIMFYSIFIVFTFRYIPLTGTDEGYYFLLWISKYN